MYTYKTYQTVRSNPNFFENVYNYYIRGGYNCIVVQNIMTIFTTAFLMLFSTIILFCIKWKEMMSCDSEDTCLSVSDYYMSQDEMSTPLKVCMKFYFSIFAIYWIWCTFTYIIQIFTFIPYKNYYEKGLGIAKDDLVGIEWNDVINSMIKYDIELNHTIIVSSIMRKDNYLIALFNKNIIGVTSFFYTNYFEWILNICILNHIFTDRHRLNIATIRDRPMIVRRFRILGILMLVFSPFILAILLVYCIVKFTADFYTKKNYFGPKEWNMYAKWKFREYNELQHIFDKRVDRSYKYAVRYEEKFNSHMINVITNQLVFVAGTLLSVLIVITLFDERISLYVKLMERNLLWYVAILTSMIAICKVFFVTPDSKSKTHNEIMKDISRYTHYYPKKWKGSVHTRKTYDSFRKLYTYKVMALVKELLGVILVPVIMIFYMPKNMNIVLQYIEDITIYHSKLGHICKYGNFELDQTGRVRYTSAGNTEEVERDSPEIPMPDPESGDNAGYRTFIQNDSRKLNLSMMNFAAHYHQNDQSDRSGQSDTIGEPFNIPLDNITVNALHNKTINDVELIRVPIQAPDKYDPLDLFDIHVTDKESIDESE